MTRSSVSMNTAAACAIALAAVVTACDRSDRRADTSAPSTATDQAQAAQAAKASPISLTGCVQKGPGMGEYILTEVNSQSTPVGTSGATSPDRVEREQLNAARHSYRLDADSDTLKDLVGHQVRVTGTMAEASDIDKRMADAHDKTDRMDKSDKMDKADRNDRAAGTSGTTANDRDRAKLDDDDLAKVKVDSVDRIADACGTAATAKPSAKGKARNRK